MRSLIPLTMVVALVACKGQNPAPTVTAEPTASVAAAAPADPAPPPNPAKLAHEKIVLPQALDAAVSVAKPFMIDKPNETSLGALLLAAWGIKHARMSDFHVAKNETTFARVRKDADEERSKRMCLSGVLIQIEKEKLDEGKVFSGLMMDGASNLFHFLAIGSTGTLVQRSQGRFCGVVTGLYDYSNSGGGTGHAVELVGMFDLRENSGS